MSDFKFSEDDSIPPPQPPKPPAGKGNEELPAKPSNFHLEGEETTPAPRAPTQQPIGPAPPDMNPKASPAANRATAQNPSAPGTPPRPANKPIPIPTPSVSIPIETAAPGLAFNDREGAPQDDFSYKIWSVGQNVKKALDVFEVPATWLLRVCLILGITCLAYILAASFFGKAGNLTGVPRAEVINVVKYLTLTSRVFMLCLLFASISLMLVTYDDNRVGFAVVGAGLICHFVVPIIFKKFVGDTIATAAMAQNFRHFGFFIVIVGLIKAVIDTFVWLFNLPETLKKKHASVGSANMAEAKQRIVAREANAFSPCWRLPFCRESIRKQCPAFLARKTCWKFGRGCYCDEEMISRIVRGEGLEAIKAPTRQSRQGKPPCGRCYIYLEHQAYKFRIMSPLALPAAVLTAWLAWPAYVKIFNLGNSAFDSVWSTLSFNSANLTPQALETTQESLKEAANLGNRPEDIALIAQNMIGVLLGFMLLIYISKFIEWAIFKAKW